MPSNTMISSATSHFWVQSHQRKVEGIQMKGEGRSLCHSSPVQCQKLGSLWRQAQGKPETGSSWIASTTCAINHRLSHPFLYSPGGNEAFPTLSQESLVVPAALTPCCGWGQQHKRNCSSDGNLFHWAVYVLISHPNPPERHKYVCWDFCAKAGGRKKNFEDQSNPYYFSEFANGQGCIRTQGGQSRKARNCSRQ